ncbi:MAG: non-homologous end-joining DNA ligase [Armatimonadota bacterium]
MRSEKRVEIDGVSLTLTNLEKVLYPESGFTKGEVIEYYLRVAPAMLPHLRGRPLTMKRFPEGVKGEYFYAKQCPHFRPEWVPVSPMGTEKKVEYCLIESRAALVWVANLASLELHTLLSRHPKLDSPTMMVFDLDPGEPAGVLEAARAALWLREALGKLGLESFAKVSGAKGVHVYVPLNTPATFGQTKSFARGLAQVLERQHPAELTSNIRKSEREGKVLVDWSQNDHHKTTVCAYSLRALARPTVSAPVSWEQLRRAVRKSETRTLTFEADQVERRVAKGGDLFAEVLTKKQRLPAARSRGSG